MSWLWITAYVGWLAICMVAVAVDSCWQWWAAFLLTITLGILLLAGGAL